jgi:hypothetical protein
MEVLTTKEYTDRSRLLAQIIIDAYGKTPQAYDDLEEQVICAFTFGCHRAFSVDAKVAEWESKLVMTQVLMDDFGFDSEMAANALEYFVDCLDPAFNGPMHIVLECGDKGYGLLSDPEELGKQLKEIVYVMGSKLEVTDPTLPGEENE